MKNSQVLQSKADVTVDIQGVGKYATVCGRTNFYTWGKGSVISVELKNLPNVSDIYFMMQVNNTVLLETIVSENGSAYAIVYTDNFTPKQISKKNIIMRIKTVADNLNCQPQGDDIDIAYGIMQINNK